MWATGKAKPRLPQDGLSRGPHRDEATGRHLYPDTNPLTRSTWDARPFLLLALPSPLRALSHAFLFPVTPASAHLFAREGGNTDSTRNLGPSFRIICTVCPKPLGRTQAPALPTFPASSILTSSIVPNISSLFPPPPLSSLPHTTQCLTIKRPSLLPPLDASFPFPSSSSPPPLLIPPTPPQPPAAICPRSPPPLPPPPG